MGMLHRIFVYGTLKSRGSHSRQLEGQRFVGTGRTLPGFTLHDLGDYPGMVREEADVDGVQGELWEVDEDCLARLDTFEGVPERLYSRIEIALRPPHDSVPAQAYLYLRPVSHRPRIGSLWSLRGPISSDGS